MLVLKPLENPTGLSLAEDSSINAGVKGGEVSPIAIEAYEAKRPRTTTLTTSVGRQAIAAVPLIQDKKVVGVAVFADALADVEANVSLIRRQILISGAVALVIRSSRATWWRDAVAAREAPGARGASRRGR